MLQCSFYKFRLRTSHYVKSSRWLPVRAIEIFTPPFRYENGFIVDSSDNIVAYSWRDKAARLIASRIRGWGRIQYMDNPEWSADEIQDEVGKIVAEALNSFWETGYIEFGSIQAVEA